MEERWVFGRDVWSPLLLSGLPFLRHIQQHSLPTAGYHQGAKGVRVCGGGPCQEPQGGQFLLISLWGTLPWRLHPQHTGDIDPPVSTTPQ